MKKKEMHCTYNPWEKKYYCSTKTKYPLGDIENCEMIINYDQLKKFIKENEKQYIFYLPFMIVNKIQEEIKLNL